MAQPSNLDPLNRIDELIRDLGLSKHPEGGFYAETYRSTVKTEKLNGVLMTSIYFLLTSENVSNFHRISNDELWFHHEGSPISIHLLEHGVHKELILGKSYGTASQTATSRKRKHHIWQCSIRGKFICTRQLCCFTWIRIQRF